MLLESLSAIEERYEELEKQITENYEDYQLIAEISKEKSDLEEVVTKARDYRAALKDFEEADGLAATAEGDFADLAKEEAARLQSVIENLEEELKSMLVPKDPRDKKNVIIEIRAGTGG